MYNEELCWADSSWSSLEDMLEDFSLSVEKYSEVEQILCSVSRSGAYGDECWVLFKGTDGKLYEVSAGHCSCYGYGGLWDPDEVSAKELTHRILHGGWAGRMEISSEVRKYILGLLPN